MTTATTTEPDNQTAAVESEDRPPQDLLSQAVGLRNEWDAGDQHDARECRDSSVTKYLELLRRKDNPLEGDARDLAQCMVDLDIDPERIMQDFEMLALASELQDQRAQLDEAHQLSIATRDEFHRREKEWEIEEHELYMKKEIANVHYGRCHSANYELEKLRRQRPLLFTKPEEGGLIRLVGTDPIE